MKPVAQYKNTFVYRLPLYTDNYAWLICHREKAWIIDPGAAEPVADLLRALDLTLAGMLVTHYHWDHVNGITELRELFSVPVYGNPKSHNLIDTPIQESTQITLGDLTLTAWETPGHTADHMSFYSDDAGWLFCGDTLFSAGCGRLKKTGDINDLYQSLKRIAGLPDSTLIFCSHEYTLNNLAFAQAVEPHNKAINSYMKITSERLKTCFASVPSMLRDEKNINSFLRCSEHSVQQAIQAKYPTRIYEGEIDFFGALRLWKDVF